VIYAPHCVNMLAVQRAEPRRFHRVVAAVLTAVVPLAAVACSDDTPAAREPSVEMGASAFATSCASCHGGDLRGTAVGPSLLSIVYEPGHHPDESFRSAIRNGVRPHHWDFGPMPQITRLTDSEIESVIMFVRAEQAEHGFEPYP
jgi:mono/diheme cytochrome c family protein